MDKKNIVMIGMPGCGKTSVGRIIAEALSMNHVDGDDIMEMQEGMKLCEIIASKGNDYVLELEERVLSTIDVEGYVISPGGSCVYYPKAMEHLREIATVVYLKVDWPELEVRCKDPVGRGIIFKPGETLKDLYDLRCPLYEQWAEITIDTTDNEDKFVTAKQLIDLLGEKELQQ